MATEISKPQTYAYLEKKYVFSLFYKFTNIIFKTEKLVWCVYA